MLAAMHAAKSLKNPMTSFGSTIGQSGNGSIVLKHAMLMDTNEGVPPSANDMMSDAHDMNENIEGDEAVVRSPAHDVLKHNEDNDEVSIQAPTWSLENWPFDKVDDSLQQQIIDDGHWVIDPLAAYSPNEDLIYPTNYKKELAGSVVVMSFRLKYALLWNGITKKMDKQQCTTEIVQIRVITKITTNDQLHSGSKRSAPPRPKFGSPSKKHAH